MLEFCIQSVNFKPKEPETVNFAKNQSEDGTVFRYETQ